MKYCSVCGSELYDEAFICMKCGCIVQRNNKTIKNLDNSKVEVKSEIVIGNKTEKSLSILNFIADFLFGLYLFFILLGLYNAEVYVSHTSTYYAYASFYLGYSESVFSLITAIIYYSISTSILIINEKNNPSRDLKTTLKYILKHIISILFVIAGICFCS